MKHMYDVWVSNKEKDVLIIPSCGMAFSGFDEYFTVEADEREINGLKRKYEERGYRVTLITYEELEEELEELTV